MFKNWSLVPREILGGGLDSSINYLISSTQIPPFPVLCESPIFILSAGWRSGSTLLQRLCCSDSNTLVWGEPFGDRIPICRLASMMKHFCEGDGHLAQQCDSFSGKLSQQWIANMNPGIGAFRNSHLAFLEALLAEPARRMGYSRWGCKEVRLSAHHVRYLSWLYPSAKFIFLVRHPLDCWRSYKGRRWYTVKTEFRVRTLPQFLAHWRYLVDSFFEVGEQSNCRLVKYEDMLSDSSELGRISDFLQINIDSKILESKIGSSSSAASYSISDRIAAFCHVRKQCKRLGYKLILE